MSIYKTAARAKVRFSSLRGDLNVEQLWDLPLTSKSGMDLNTIAKAVNKELSDVAEENFVDVKADPKKDILVLKLDILRDVIDTVQQENKKRLESAERRQQRERLEEILHSKKEDALKSESIEEIQRRIAELNG